MLTLIATTPNLVVNDYLQKSGHNGFAFFSFFPVGIAVLIVAIGYVLGVRGWLLPSSKHEQIEEERTRDILELWEEFSRRQVSRGVVCWTGFSIGEYDDCRIRNRKSLRGSCSGRYEATDFRRDGDDAQFGHGT